MEYTTLNPSQEVGETGQIYERGSLYGYFHTLKDPRHAKGKRYSLVTLLTIILLGKLAGKDNPVEISDWARNHADEIVALLKLKHDWMPSHSTIRKGKSLQGMRCTPKERPLNKFLPWEGIISGR